MRTLVLILGVLVWRNVVRSPEDLPNEIRQTLDGLHSGWDFAELDSTNSQHLQPGEKPDWVTGNLDGQGKPDYVVQIVAPARPENSQQLVVGFIAQGQGFTAVSIDSAAKSHDTYLRVNRRGTRGFNINTHQWFTYKRDVLSILYNQTAGMDCPYAEGRFTCRISGD